MPSSVTDSTEMVQHGELTAKRHLVLLAVAILCFSLCLSPVSHLFLVANEDLQEALCN